MMSAESQSTAAGLLDIPPEVMLEYLLPELGVKDLARLSRVNRMLYDLTSDETLWLHLTQRDFSFSPTLLAPPPAPFFKKLYLGMASPQPCVWGSSDRSRLGNASDPRYPMSVRSRRTYIDTPAPLLITDGGMTWSENLQRDLVDACQSVSGSESEKAKFSGGGGVGRRVGVVEMVAGGWSFAARDQDGGVYVWGQLDGGRFVYGAAGWEDKYCQVPEPTRIPLPCRAESISSGRTHLLVLDSDNLIWEFRSWGRAYHHTAPSLTSPTNRGASARPHHILQISAGWSHSACLTSSGDIYLWFPFSDEYTAALTPDEGLCGPLSPPTTPSPESGSISRRDVKWGKVNGSIIHPLEAISERPDLVIEENDDEELKVKKEAKVLEWTEWQSRNTDQTLEEGRKLVKIASGANFLLALRANGEVWACSVSDQIIGQWVYLHWFSGPDIKHITAQFEWITSYSDPRSKSKSGSTSSSINHARLTDLSPASNPAPIPLPALADKTIIQVALGDHHHVALTSQGEVYTWGEGSNGQLGLGDGRHHVDEPRRVTFPGEEEGEKAFIFGITAGGWHTGALALGGREKSLKGKEVSRELEEAAEKRNEDGEKGGEDDGGSVEQRTGRMNFGTPYFRVGFAGRGAIGRGGTGIRGLRWNRGHGNDGGPSDE